MKGKLTFKNILRVAMIIFPVALIAMMGSVYKEKITIERLEPAEVIVGNGFNLSVMGTGFDTLDEIYINGKACPTTFGNAEWITCTVSPEIAQSEGALKVQVLRKENNRVLIESNIEQILVKASE